jgi:hypothetical protein
MEINMEVPQKKKKIELPYNPAILLGMFQKESKSSYSRDTCTPVFIVTLLNNSQIMISA